MNLKRHSIITACMAALAAAAHSGQTVEGPHLDRSAVVSLLHASDVVALDKAYKGVRANAGLNVLYRTLRLRMQPTRDNELALLGTVPRTFDDFLLYIALDDPDNSAVDDSVWSDVVDGYFERIARLAVKNHSDLRPYLVLHSFADGYLRDYSQEWLDWLLQHRRQAVLSAYRTLDAGTKRGVCGDDCGEFERK